MEYISQLVPETQQPNLIFTLVLLSGKPSESKLSGLLLVTPMFILRFVLVVSHVCTLHHFSCLSKVLCVYQERGEGM